MVIASHWLSAPIYSATVNNSHQQSFWNLQMKGTKLRKLPKCIPSPQNECWLEHRSKEQQVQPGDLSNLMQSSFWDYQECSFSMCWGLAFLIVFFFFSIVTGYSGFILRCERYWRRQYQISYIMRINTAVISFFGYCKAGCYFKAISHMLLYLRVKLFISIQRCFILLLNRRNFDKYISAFF